MWSFGFADIIFDVFFSGTPGAGHTDKLARLKDLCDQYNMWLHVEGWVSLYNRWSLKTTYNTQTFSGLRKLLRMEV